MILTEWNREEYARRLKKMYEEDAHEEWIRRDKVRCEKVIKSLQKLGWSEEAIETVRKSFDEEIE